MGLGVASICLKVQGHEVRDIIALTLRSFQEMAITTKNKQCKELTQNKQQLGQAQHRLTSPTQSQHDSNAMHTEQTHCIAERNSWETKANGLPKELKRLLVVRYTICLLFRVI